MTDHTLTDAESQALDDMAGCGCCAHHHAADALWDDGCPRTDEYVDHTYADDCIAGGYGLMRTVELIVAARMSAAWMAGAEAACDLETGGARWNPTAYAEMNPYQEADRD